MEAFVVLLLAFHLVCVNVASVAPLVAVWWERREARGDSEAGVWGRRLMWQSIGLLALGSLLGVLVGYLRWDHEYRNAVHLLANKVHFGVWEMLFSFILMTIHAIWWGRTTAPRHGPRIVRGGLAFLASTNLLYHFPVLMVIMARLAGGDDLTTEPIDAAAFRVRLMDPVVLSRCVHIWLASFAVTGAWLIAWSAWSDPENRAAPSPPSNSGNAHEPVVVPTLGRRAVWGARLALIPTLLQIPVGIWLLVTLPAYVQSRLLGSDLVGSLLLGCSVFLALWLMHLLASIALGPATRDQQRRAVTLMLLIVLLMTAVLRRLNDPLDRARPDRTEQLLRVTPASSDSHIPSLPA